MSKRIILLGSTGSIGTSALRVVDALPGRFEICGLAVDRRYREALAQAERYGVSRVAVGDGAAARACRAAAPPGIEVLEGEEGVADLAGETEADVVLCALVGTSGLRPVLRAAERGIDIALATKEVLVSAGRIVTELCARSGSRLLPVDSEHSAVFQCLAGRGCGPCPSTREDGHADVRRLILTASGGPFGLREDVDLSDVSIDEALDHPRWDMGRKVTVDSATLINKGLEIIEAQWLFNLPLDRIDVLLHPESIVHSLVEFADGSVLAQLSPPDMRYAIQYALTYPERVDGALPLLDLAAAGALHFRVPDEKRFPGLRLAREAGRIGGSLPTVLNAANEVAVEAFLNGRLHFSGIWHLVEEVLAKHENQPRPELEDILAADAWARATAWREVDGLTSGQ